MYRIIVLTLSLLFSCSVIADKTIDNKNVKRAVLDYIESQHKVEPDLMKRGLDEKLAKRTYWKSKDGSEFIKDEHLIEAAEEHLDFLEGLNPLSMDPDKVEAKQQKNESYWNPKAPKNSLRVVDATYAKVKFSDLKLKTYLKKR